MSMPISTDSADAKAAGNALRRSRGRWRILAFVALALVVLVGLARFMPMAGGVPDRVARIEVSGVIASDRDRLAVLDRLARDESVQAVIVSINSPGGTTAGGEELYEALLRLAEAKPVVAVIDELGASAAYMTAIATDRVFARRLSIVGSIGVLYQHVDASRLLDTIGIDLDKVASGPLKAEPAYDAPMSPEARESIGQLVGDSYQWFVDIVAERRGLDRRQALVLADGRIVSGRMAVESGLVDAIGGEREALDWLEADQGLATDLPLYTAYPLPRRGIDRWAGWFVDEARAGLGLPPAGPIALDGLVSLWHP